MQAAYSPAHLRRTAALIAAACPIDAGAARTWIEERIADGLRQAQLFKSLFSADHLTRHPRSLLTALSLSFLAWLIFYPTVYSHDSFFTLIEATRGRFSDWHPILTLWILYIALRIPVDISLVTLLQLSLGFLGIRRLVLVLVRYFGVPATKIADRSAVGVLGILATPLTPLGIYLATFWSDTWLAISLLWALALLLEMREGDLGRAALQARVLWIIVWTALAILARYNAIVTYPFLALVFFTALRARNLRGAPSLFLILCPLLLAGAFLAIQYRAHKIWAMHPERAVYALDLASMIKYDPSICQNLSIQSCDLVLQEFYPSFLPGNGAIDLTLNQGLESMYDPFLRLFEDPRLSIEYRMTALDHPALLGTVKFLNFLDYIGRDHDRYFFQRSIWSKDIVEMPGQKFASPIGFWFNLTRRIIDDDVWSWFSFVHAVWLIANLLGLLIVGVYIWRSHDEQLARVWQLLWVPLSYYGSYLLALPSSDFRYMYPSMLTMQVLTLTFLTAGVAKWLGNRSHPAWAPQP